MIKYAFNAEGHKMKDSILLYDYTSTNEYLIFEDDIEVMEKFDEFFNKNINVILKSIETFIDIYPKFSINIINNNEKLNIFYMEMKKMYEDGVFNEGLNENLTVIKMMSI